MMNKVYAVSVVRDFDLYAKCLRDNPFCSGMELLPVDNREKNLPIPVIYNNFLDAFDGEGWIVFCHEDWQPLCDLPSILEPLPKNHIYGPIGVYLDEKKHSSFKYIIGNIVHGGKEGETPSQLRGAWPSGRVDCLDCQCLIVHSSLVKEYGLRFDPALEFDMYGEDFCAGAHFKHGIHTIVVPIPCHHHSKGVIGDRFRKSLEYMRNKYDGSPKRYMSIVGRQSYFGGSGPVRHIHTLSHSVFSKIRYYLYR